MNEKEISSVINRALKEANANDSLTTEYVLSIIADSIKSGEAKDKYRERCSC